VVCYGVFMGTLSNPIVSNDAVIQKLKSENEKLQAAYNIIHFDEHCSPELRDAYLKYLAKRAYVVDEYEAS
jgi:hypothetical protein